MGFLIELVKWQSYIRDELELLATERNVVSLMSDLNFSVDVIGQKGQNNKDIRNGFKCDAFLYINLKLVLECLSHLRLLLLNHLK